MNPIPKESKYPESAAQFNSASLKAGACSFTKQPNPKNNTYSKRDKFIPQFGSRK
jgi:hypothetical protein